MLHACQAVEETASLAPFQKPDCKAQRDSVAAHLKLDCFQTFGIKRGALTCLLRGDVAAFRFGYLTAERTKESSMNRIITFVAVVTIFFVTDSQAAPERLLSEVDIKPGENASALVVLLHGYTLDGNSLMHVQETLGRIDELKGADILRPNLPLDTFSMATSSQITAELILAIDQAWGKT
jgi:hypothetical protein